MGTAAGREQVRATAEISANSAAWCVCCSREAGPQGPGLGLTRCPGFEALYGSRPV